MKKISNYFKKNIKHFQSIEVYSFTLLFIISFFSSFVPIIGPFILGLIIIGFKHLDKSIKKREFIIPFIVGIASNACITLLFLENFSIFFIVLVLNILSLSAGILSEQQSQKNYSITNNKNNLS